MKCTPIIRATFNTKINTKRTFFFLILIKVYLIVLIFIKGLLNVINLSPFFDYKIKKRVYNKIVMELKC